MNHVDTPSPIKHISLCAGYGGIDLGLKRAIPSIRTILFSEIEAFACANLVSKMEAGLLDAAPIWTNLKTLPWDQFCGKVDIVSGGFPCQPFSAAGKRQGDEDPRHLFPYILEGIGRCRPSIVFLENVEGILSAKLAGDNWRDPAGTPVLLHVFRELERVGYKCTAGIFSASEVGAPHQRKRVFILADRIDEGSQGRLLRWPNPEGKGINGHSGCGGSSLFGRWPARPGEHQYEWEPPRVLENTKRVGRGGRDHGDAPRDGREVQAKGSRPREVGNSKCVRLEPTGYQGAEDHGKIVSEICRNIDGTTDRLGNAKLYVSYDNRIDELRLLGNGVVAATAELALRTLWEELTNE